MLKENFNDILIVGLYSLVFVCWLAIFLYGMIKLIDKKK